MHVCHAADPSKPAKVKFNIEGGLNHYSETLAIESAHLRSGAWRRGNHGPGALG